MLPKLHLKIEKQSFNTWMINNGTPLEQHLPQEDATHEINDISNDFNSTVSLSCHSKLILYA